MASTTSQVLQCIILPVGRVLSVAVPQYNLAAIRAALSKETACAADAFLFFTKANKQFIPLTEGSEKQDAIYALLRCRGGGKGGFRKQLEKKGREFARAKLKERRNNAKSAAKKEISGTPKKKEDYVKAKVLKAEVNTTRALIKQGLAFVMNQHRKNGTAL